MESASTHASRITPASGGRWPVSSARHTPGPWQNSDGTIYAQGGAHVATVHPSAMRVTIEREAHDRANAALIAAAPELLEALEALLEGAGFENGEAPPILRELSAPITRWRAAYAAVAKARGEEVR